MNSGGDHSAYGLQYVQAPRGRRSGVPGWPCAPAPRGLGGGYCHRGCSPLRTTDRKLPHPAAVACEDRAVWLLARRISENAAEIESLTSEISALLSADETHRCLLTVPGIGPRTASELVISIDIADFASHDRLASYCGLVPRNRRSGTSISSVSASRQGNKRLKNLLVFSCNCLARSRNRWGDYYARCRERGMPHGKALKAVARKRLKVIYAIMRDKVPYAA